MSIIILETPENKTLRGKMVLKDKDKGLNANKTINDEIHNGKHKVPTLRNVMVTAPYMHNGVFKDLKQL